MKRLFGFMVSITAFIASISLMFAGNAVANNVAPVATTVTAAAPTLNEWGMLSLVVIMGGAGLYKLIRK